MVYYCTKEQTELKKNIIVKVYLHSRKMVIPLLGDERLEEIKGYKYKLSTSINAIIQVDSADGEILKKIFSRWKCLEKLTLQQRSALSIQAIYESSDFEENLLL